MASIVARIRGRLIIGTWNGERCDDFFSCCCFRRLVVIVSRMYFDVMLFCVSSRFRNLYIRPWSLKLKTIVSLAPKVLPDLTAFCEQSGITHKFYEVEKFKEGKNPLSKALAQTVIEVLCPLRTNLCIVACIDQIVVVCSLSYLASYRTCTLASLFTLLWRHAYYGHDYHVSSQTTVLGYVDDSLWVLSLHSRRHHFDRRVAVCEYDDGIDRRHCASAAVAIVALGWADGKGQLFVVSFFNDWNTLQY